MRMGTYVLEWLNDLTMDIESLETREALLKWRAITTENDQARHELIQTKKESKQFYAQDERFSKLAPLWHKYGQRLGRDEARQMGTLYSRHLIAQINDDSIIEEIDSCVGQARVRSGMELVRVRNEGARRLGYPDYYSLVLAANDLDGRWIRLLLDRMEQRLAAPGGRDATNEADLKLSQGWIDGVAKYFDAIGLRLGGVLARSHIGKEPFGQKTPLVFHVDKLDDVRVICSVDDTPQSCQRLLHTLGVAVYPANILNHLPYLLRRPPHFIAHQASGILFERLIASPQWLTEWTGVSPAKAEAMSDHMRRQDATKKYEEVRKALNFIRLEEAVYKGSPDQLEHVWNKHAASLSNEEAATWVWTLAHRPLHHQINLLAEMTASALNEALDRELGRHALVASPAAGYFLIDYWYYHGARYRWDELCARLFGHIGDLVTKKE